MAWLKELEAFWMSEAGGEFYRNLTVIGFWISIPICLFMVFLIVRMGREYEAKKKEINKMIHAPGMDDVRWLLKGRLKGHGIQPDERAHELN